jgi:type II secretory pathway component PulJ
MLVATAILAILVTLLMAAISHTVALFSRADAQKFRQQTARLALEMITRDLEAAAFPLVSTQTNSLQFVVNPPIDGIPLNRDAAFWQAAVPGDTSSSDLSEVGYFIVWTTRDGVPTSELRRLRVPPNAPDSIFQNPTNWLSAQKLETYAPGSGGTGSNALKGLIAQNVLGLWIRLYDRNDTLLYPSAGFGSSYDSRVNTRPASAEVALVITDPRTAKRIARASDFTDKYWSYATPEEFAASFRDRDLQSGIQVFKERVELHAAESSP